MSEASGPIHILVDSTGLKVHRGNRFPSEPRNRRSWRKLHLAVNFASGEIVASALTNHGVNDATQVPNLLDQIPAELASLTADGAYDSYKVYDAAETHSSERSPRVIIPPRRNTRSRKKSGIGGGQRVDTIRKIEEIGRRRWQKESGYTRRSLVEAAISRYKRIMGGRLRSRTTVSQQTEVRIGCSVLNRMTQLGMPDGYCVT